MDEPGKVLSVQLGDTGGCSPRQVAFSKLCVASALFYTPSLCTPISFLDMVLLLRPLAGPSSLDCRGNALGRC